MDPTVDLDVINDHFVTAQNRGVKSARSPEKARAAAQDFEAMLISQLLQPMFDSLPTDGPFGGGQAERIYRSLMVQEFGKSLAQNGGLGMADAVYREILQIQEGQDQ